MAGAAGGLLSLPDLADLMGDEEDVHIVCMNCLSLDHIVTLCGQKDPGPMVGDDAAVTCFDCIEVEENSDICPNCGVRFK